MARSLRIEYPGAVYHVTSRGNALADVFITDEDRRTFLAVLAEVIGKYNWYCHAYCLLDNHYHLIIETPEANLSLGMRQLNGVYTQAFNRFRQRVGHLFQGRYTAIIIEKEGYLLELCRYVVLNPVRLDLVAHPGDWKWSSFSKTAYAVKPPEFLTTNWVLARFSENRTKARRLYRKFVAEGQQNPTRPWDNLLSRIFLGSEDFVRHISEFLGDKEKSKEIPLIQRYLGRPPLEQLFADIDKSMRLQRNARIIEAHLTHGYSLKKISDFLGIHYTTASKAVFEKRAKEK